LEKFQMAISPQPVDIHMFGTNVVFGVGVLYGSTSGWTKSKRRPHVILENFKWIRFMIH